MKKKNIYITIIAILFIVFIGVVIYGYFSKKQEQRDKQARLSEIQLSMDVYTDALNIRCEYVIENDKLVVLEQEVVEWNLMIEVELYNACTEDDVTPEELLEEYNIYCRELKDSKLLDDYAYFIGNMMRINGLSRQDYSSMIVGELNNRNINWDKASNEEIRDVVISIASTLKKPQP